MNLEVLRRIGLSEGEVKVYGALLEIGITSINNIHEKVCIDRRNIYDILNKLIERGLVSYSEENGKRVFRITNPDKILSYIEEKKANLEEVKGEVSKVIPLIQEAFKSQKQELFSEIFRGAEGIKAVWEDMLNYKEVRWLGSGYYVPDKFPAFFKQWNKRRAENKILTIHLFREDKKEVVSKKLFPHSRFLPSEFNGNPTVTVIFGNKVAQFLFGENLFAFVIESKELAENYRGYHRYLWDKVSKK